MKSFWFRMFLALGATVIFPKFVLADSSHLAYERKELLAVASELAESLKELRSLEKAKALRLSLTEVSADTLPTEGAMEELVTLSNWTGEIESLLSSIAERYNYQLVIMGKKPPLPLLVSISARKKMLRTIIQDADLQLGKQGHITVKHDPIQVIELRYATETV